MLLQSPVKAPILVPLNPLSRNPKRLSLVSNLPQAEELSQSRSCPACWAELTVFLLWNLNYP